MNILLWVVAALTGAVFVWVASLNGIVFWNRFVRRRQTPSWIPFLGGICGVVSILTMPVAGIRWWWWVPLMIDWGSIPGTLDTIVHLISSSFADRGKNDPR